MPHAPIERGAGGRFRLQGAPDTPPKPRTKKGAADAPTTLGAVGRRLGGSPADPQDTNLPDESAGETVATEDTFDSSHQGPGENRPFKTSSRRILGGSAEDPRWDEFNRRKTLQGQAERATPRSSYLRQGAR